MQKEVDTVIVPISETRMFPYLTFRLERTPQTRVLAGGGRGGGGARYARNARGLRDFSAKTTC